MSGSYLVGDVRLLFQLYVTRYSCKYMLTAQSDISLLCYMMSSELFHLICHSCYVSLCNAVLFVPVNFISVLVRYDHTANSLLLVIISCFEVVTLVYVAL